MAPSKNLTYLRKKVKVGVRGKREASVDVNKEDGVSWTFSGHNSNHPPDWAVSIFPAYFSFLFFFFFFNFQMDSHWNSEEIVSLHSDLCWAVAVSVQFSCSVVSDSLRPHEPQHARLSCQSPTPGVHSNPCPLSQWCDPGISSSVVPFSSCPQSFPASGSF